MDARLRNSSKDYLIIFVFQLLTFAQAPDSEVNCLLIQRFLYAKNLNDFYLIEKVTGFFFFAF